MSDTRERIEMQIEGHRIVAVSFNPDTPGPPLVMMHGITVSVNMWTPDTVAPFIPYGPCYALSLPGHYPAAFPPGFRGESLTAGMIARVLTAAIRELVGDRRVIVGGHSTGGFAGLDIAAHNPEIALGVISISGFARGEWIGALGMLQGLARNGPFGQFLFKSVFKANRSTRAVHRTSWRSYAANPGRLFAYPHLDDVIDGYFPDFRLLDLDAMTHYFSRMPDIDITSMLPRIAAPTLVVTGDKDPIVSPSQARLIARGVPDAELVVVKDAGHVPSFENTADYNRAVGDWLARHFG